MYSRQWWFGGVAVACLFVGVVPCADADGPEVIQNGGVTKTRLLPPTPGKNPRNSEGAFVQLKDGKAASC